MARVPGRAGRARSGTADLFGGSDDPLHALARERPLRIAGVDEAGRGPLAGPVAVAAVILDPARRIRGLDDSKRLSETAREALYPRILERALAWRIEFVEREEIDRINILQATFVGMRRALEGLVPTVDAARIDGNLVPRGLPCPAVAIIGGDGLERAIMAASILAKVARDRRMRELHALHPHYGFERHKGYASAAHLAALAAHGPCAEHRRSYAPVREALARIARDMPPEDAPADHVPAAPAAAAGAGTA